MKILIGIDHSKISEDVSRAILTQFHTGHVEFRVLHVLQPVTFSAPPEMTTGYAPELEPQKKPADELVERFAQKLRSAGFNATTSVEIGDVREGIIDCAAKWHADLIVVGSHGQSGIQRILLGSVAEFVARHAKCSVEIVRAPDSV